MHIWRLLAPNFLFAMVDREKSALKDDEFPKVPKNIFFTEKSESFPWTWPYEQGHVSLSATIGVSQCFLGKHFFHGINLII